MFYCLYPRFLLHFIIVQGPVFHKSNHSFKGHNLTTRNPEIKQAVKYSHTKLKQILNVCLTCCYNPEDKYKMDLKHLQGV